MATSVRATSYREESLLGEVRGRIDPFEKNTWEEIAQLKIRKSLFFVAFFFYSVCHTHTHHLVRILLEPQVDFSDIVTE